MSNTKTFTLTTLLSALCFACSPVFAATDASASTTTAPHAVTTKSEYKPHVGAQLGIANPEGQYDTGTEYTFDVGVQPYIPFGMGLEFGHTQANSRTSADDLDRNLLLLKGTYNFAGENFFIQHSYVGFGLGRSFESGGDHWVSAPLAGFDIPVASFFEDRTSVLTLGAVAKYFIYEGSNADSLALNAMAKYWF